MIPRTSRLFAILLLLPFLAVFALAGCQSAGRIGANVAEQDRIAIAGASGPLLWQTRDLTVTGSYSRTGDTLDLTGNVSGLRYMRGLQYFNLQVYALDAGGKVVASEPLLGTSSEDLMSFSKRIALPPGAVAIALGYSGASNAKDMGDISIWYDPTR